jgi:hypothetical protein
LPEAATQFWVLSADGDRTGFALYRRHYSARKNPRPKIRQFVGPGQKMVLIGFMCNALFAWRKFIDDSGETGVNCAVFRNESGHRSSDMILEAMVFAWDRWPGERLYTTVDPEATRRRRGKKNPPGYCFRMAGWSECGTTKSGLMILECNP